MVRTLIVFAVLAVFLPTCFGRGQYLGKEELNSFLKNFYSHYAPSDSRSQRDVSFIPPGTSVYQEPSSRDLDVGIGIGVKDDDSDLQKVPTGNSYSPPNPFDRGYLPQEQAKEVNIGLYVDPRNGVSYYLPQPQQFSYGTPQQLPLPNTKVGYDPAMFLNNVQSASFTGPGYGSRPPLLNADIPLSPYPLQSAYRYRTALPSAPLQYPLDYPTQNTVPYFHPTEQDGRYRYEMAAPLQYPTQGKSLAYDSPFFPSQRLEGVEGVLRYPGQAVGSRTFHKFFEVEDNAPYYRRDNLAGTSRGLVPRSETLEPLQGLMAEPYGERQVGAFRLRNDHGYQVTMNVPRMPEDGPTEGVLVMEMKATLYRPVQ